MDFLTWYRSVDLVYSRLSFNQYARKRFIRPKDSQKDQQLLKRFDREISSLKRLSHQHLVAMIGSYTDQKSVAYLMTPVGECNLFHYLCQSRSFIDQRLPSLRNYFGCLANAVAYLHRQRIRHRDLKPQNILIKNHDIYITDFGTALDWSKRGRDTTNDPATPFTEQYMAPEVAKRFSSSRNSASDIWSLGVVFLDMVTVLCGSTIRDLRIFLETHGNRHPCVWNNSSGTNEWFTKLRQMNAGPDSDNEPMMWIKDMLQYSSQNRPSSGALTHQIRSAAGLGLFIGHCCGTDDEMEDFPSPPLSGISDEDTELYLDDIPPELLDEKPFGSLIESSRQNNIERWLDAESSASSRDYFVPNMLSEPPAEFEENGTDLAYDIVEDQSTVVSTGLEDDMAEFNGRASTPHQVVVTYQGYDVVQDDSDEEEQTRFAGVGYEVMEDSSGSEATVRQPAAAPSSARQRDARGATTASNFDTDNRSISAKEVKLVESQLDALEVEDLDREGLKYKDNHESSTDLDSSSIDSSKRGVSLGMAISANKGSGQKEGETSSQETSKAARNESPTISPRAKGITPAILKEKRSKLKQRSITSQNQSINIELKPQNLSDVDKGTTLSHSLPPNKPDKRQKQKNENGQEPLTVSKLESLNALNSKKAISPSSQPTRADRNHQKEKGAGDQKPSKKSESESLNAPETRFTTMSNSAPTNNRRTQLKQENMAKMLEKELQITPSIYMQEVWEAASSVATSVMSETTRKAFGTFGSGLAWQDRSANFLEKYVRLGKAAAVRELLQAGCNPGTKEKPRIRPLMLGVKGGSQRHNKCVSALLLAGADVNARDRSGRTALHYAIEHQHFHGYTNLIRDLLEAGADPNNKDRSGDFPLLQILYGGYEQLQKHKRDALACLLQQDFVTDVSVVHEGTGNTPLHLAVRRKDPWAVSMLIVRGAKVNKPNGSGSTPLMLAANAWNIKISTAQNKVLQFLLDGGAKVNEQNELGKTALHLAASNLCQVAVGLLLDKGADPMIKDAEGHRASFYAGNPPKNILKAPETHATIMEMLVEAMAPGILSSLPFTENECCVVTAVSKCDLATVTTLFESCGAQPNQLHRSTNNTPLLHLALRTEDRAKVKYLTKLGAFVDVEDGNGNDAFKVCDSLGNTTGFTQYTAKYMKSHGKRSKIMPETKAAT